MDELNESGAAPSHGAEEPGMRLPEIAQRIKQIDVQLAVIPPGQIVYRTIDGLSRPFRE